MWTRGVLEPHLGLEVMAMPPGRRNDALEAVRFSETPLTQPVEGCYDPTPMIILSLLFVLILAMTTILATKRNLSDSLILTLTLFLVVILGPLLITLYLYFFPPACRDS